MALQKKFTKPLQKISFNKRKPTNIVKQNKLVIQLLAITQVICNQLINNYI